MSVPCGLAQDGLPVSLQIIGRPHRLRMLDRFVRAVGAYPGTWIAACREIAAYVKAATA